MDKLQKAQENKLLIPSASTTSLLQCLLKNNPIEIIQAQSEVRLQTAVNGTALGTLKRQDKVQTQNAIANLIANLVQSLNLGNTLNDAQVVEIVYLLMERYYYLKLEELILIFKKAKMGDYGKNYNRLDIQVIFEWIEMYYSSDERALLLEREAKNFKEKEKSNDYKKQELPEFAKEILKKMQAEILPDTPKEKKPYTTYNERDYLSEVKEASEIVDNNYLKQWIKACEKEGNQSALIILKAEQEGRKKHKD